MNEIFKEIVMENTAGNPMKAEILWTDLSKKVISEKFTEKDKKVSPYIVAQLLKKNGFVKKKAKKSLTMKEVENRDKQFKYISELKNSFKMAYNPVLSIDTKKKELIGNFYREGKLFTKETLKVYDHDFPSFSDGIVIPHGIYDTKNNKGYISIGKSKDTSEFCVDNLIYYWENFISKDYPIADSILLIGDGGGSNSSRSYLTKNDLQRLSNTINLKVRVAHYPPYCSKWNPIEHRLFPHVTRAMEGVVFESYEIVEQLIKKSKTESGLTVETVINPKVYQTGRKLSKKDIEEIKFTRDSFLPNWNYFFNPQ